MQTNYTLRHYLETALWASTDDDGEPLDREYSPSDFSDDARERARADCARFESENSDDIDAFLGFLEGSDYREGQETVGHCLFLSRNGHGSGFFDRFTYADSLEARECAYRLQHAAHAFGESAPYVGDDEALHFY